MSEELRVDRAADLRRKYSRELHLISQYCVTAAEVTCAGGSCWALSGLLPNGLEVGVVNGDLEAVGHEEPWSVGVFAPGDYQVAYLVKGVLNEQLDAVAAITVEQARALIGGSLDAAALPAVFILI
ncbi:hypothetical protein [Nocardia altamirensis]|uniref:hypothetical protein n=1 Tax=Nocardia altamirensis TaxID=472158 RepID=UPI0008404DF6|nr:hypothetical protein [Nocardia altamirensis]